MCMVLLLSGCKEPAVPPGSPEALPAEGTLRFSAAMSYEDRQMMKRYLLQGLHDGLVAVAEMQARIGQPDFAA